MSQVTNLKNCPFCGGEVKFEENDKQLDVLCLSCGLSAVWHYISKADAIFQWNTRCYDKDNSQKKVGVSYF